MTEATEYLGGTSGRGNPGFVRAIEGCEITGTVQIERRGRTRWVRRVQGIPVNPNAYRINRELKGSQV